MASRAEGRLDSAIAARLPLLDGMESIPQALQDPELAPRLMEFMSASSLAPVNDVEIVDRVADGPHGPIGLRCYHPAATRTTSALLWVHGGGFTHGSAFDPAGDALCSVLARRSGSLVVSVDYRLAVGGVHFPVPHDDVVAALRWLRASASDLGVDAGRITVGGDSAGGNLAAGAALRTRDEDGRVPAALVLAYPILHAVLPPLSRDVVASVAGLPDLLRFLPEDVSGMVRNYVGGPESRADGYAMPGLADLEGLCPVLVVNSECDDLRASGEAFVAAAALAGVEVQQMTAKGMLHAFLVMSDEVPQAARARRRIADVVAEAAL